MFINYKIKHTITFYLELNYEIVLVIDPRKHGHHYVFTLSNDLPSDAQSYTME